MRIGRFPIRYDNDMEYLDVMEGGEVVVRGSSDDAVNGACVCGAGGSIVSDDNLAGKESTIYYQETFFGERA